MEVRNAADLLDEVDRLRAAVLMKAETIAAIGMAGLNGPSLPRVQGTLRIISRCVATTSGHSSSN